MVALECIKPHTIKSNDDIRKLEYTFNVILDYYFINDVITIRQFANAVAKCSVIDDNEKLLFEISYVVKPKWFNVILYFFTGGYKTLYPITKQEFVTMLEFTFHVIGKHKIDTSDVQGMINIINKEFSEVFGE